MTGEERIPLGNGPLEFFKDANGRGYLYCTRCHDQPYIGDMLEMFFGGRLRKWWWILTHLRFMYRVMWPHLWSCAVLNDEGDGS